MNTVADSGLVETKARSGRGSVVALRPPVGPVGPVGPGQSSGRGEAPGNSPGF